MSAMNVLTTLNVQGISGIIVIAGTVEHIKDEQLHSFDAYN